MAIERLNFSGANSGSGNIDTPLGTLSDRLMKYGSMLNSQDAERERLKMEQDQIAYSKGRDALEDTRYDADKKLQAEEKVRLLGKEYNTGRAALALTDPESLKKEALAGEQKAIETTLANASPELRLQIQQELKGYNPAESGKQWVDTALGQSNVDAGMITNLKRDIAKQAADEKYKDESLALQKRQNEIASQARADSLKLQREELDFKKQQLTKPELSAKQKEFKGNLALFGNDEEKAGIATFGSDEWKKIKGTYQDETTKKDSTPGMYSDNSMKTIDEKVRTGAVVGAYFDSSAQEMAAKTRSNLETIQKSLGFKNSEMDKIIPLIVGKAGELNYAAIDELYGNKVNITEDSNKNPIQINMGDAIKKIADNPYKYLNIRLPNGKSEIVPVESTAGLKAIANMGADELENRGLTEKYKELQLKELKDKVSKGTATQDEKDKLNTITKPSEPGVDALLNKKLDNVVTKPGQLTKEEYLKQAEERKALGKELTKDVSGLIGETFSGADRNRIAFESGIVNKVKNGEQLSPEESKWINQMRNSQRPYDKFRLKELGLE